MVVKLRTRELLAWSCDCIGECIRIVLTSQTDILLLSSHWEL